MAASFTFDAALAMAPNLSYWGAQDIKTPNFWWRGTTSYKPLVCLLIIVSLCFFVYLSQTTCSLLLIFGSLAYYSLICAHKLPRTVWDFLCTSREILSLEGSLCWHFIDNLIYGVSINAEFLWSLRVDHCICNTVCLPRINVNTTAVSNSNTGCLGWWRSIGY
jgi:hypothetical protein